MVPRAGSGNSKTGVQCIPSTRKICTCTEPVLISNLYKREYLVHPPILSAETQLLICSPKFHEILEALLAHNIFPPRLGQLSAVVGPARGKKRNIAEALAEEIPPVFDGCYRSWYMLVRFHEYL